MLFPLFFNSDVFVVVAGDNDVFVGFVSDINSFEDIYCFIINRVTLEAVIVATIHHHRAVDCRRQRVVIVVGRSLLCFVYVSYVPCCFLSMFPVVALLQRENPDFGLLILLLLRTPR